MYKNSLKAFGLLIFTFIMKKLCHIIYKISLGYEIEMMQLNYIERV